jgi:putative transposase
MAIPQEVLEQMADKLLADYKKPEDVLGESGILKQMTKAILERALQGEMTHHLGYRKYDTEEKRTVNARNGKSKKTLSGEMGVTEIAVPRDREATFEPQIVKKGQRRFTGFDDKILSLYARGLSTREIQGHLEEIYGVGVSPELISTVTDEVRDEVREWQNRPLETTYVIVYLDALFVKVRDEGHVKNKAVYLAIGVTLEGD